MRRWCTTWRWWDGAIILLEVGVFIAIHAANVDGQHFKHFEHFFASDLVGFASLARHPAPLLLDDATGFVE